MSDSPSKTTTTTTSTTVLSLHPRLATGTRPTFEKKTAVAHKSATSSATIRLDEDPDDDEPSPNITKLLLDSHTSTDGSESPKIRWTRGPPPSLDTEPNTSTAPATPEQEEDAPPSPHSLRSCRTKSSGSSSIKPFVAWTWLLEDEGASEPRLQKPVEGDRLALPQLMDAERELLHRSTELRLQEVGRQAKDIPALVEEYLRFIFLRNRLEGLLTIEPSTLVDDVWHAHTASRREYVAFCERAFGAQWLESAAPHRQPESSQLIPYQNTVAAYEHFFGACPPADFWPAVQSVGADATVKDEEGAAKIRSPCRRSAFVRSTEKKFHIATEA